MFTHLYGFKNSCLILMCTQLYSFKYSSLILIISKVTGFKYSYLILIMYTQGFKSSCLILIICMQLYSFIYGCTTWMLTKRLEKKLDSNYTRMLRAILNKSWRQHPTRQQLYGHLPPITKSIQVRRTRHAGHCWRSKDELISDVLLWTPHIWPSKSRMTSSNIHTAAMWGHRM